MPDTQEKLFERVIILETNLTHQQNAIEELKDLYREDMEAIKHSLNKIEEQTSRWKGIAGGIFIAMTLITTAIQWIFNTFGITIKDFLSIFK